MQFIECQNRRPYCHASFVSIAPVRLGKRCDEGIAPYKTVDGGVKTPPYVIARAADPWQSVSPALVNYMCVGADAYIGPSCSFPVIVRMFLPPAINCRSHFLQLVIIGVHKAKIYAIIIKKGEF